MASPALSPPRRALDPSKKGHYDIHLSDRITKSGQSRGGYTSVKVNHKPVQKGDSRAAHIKNAEDGPVMTLEDKDGSKPGKYTYKGQRTTSKRSYVLIFDPEKQSCTLEPISASYAFNLQTTPWETNTSILEDKYAQIPLARDGLYETGAIQAPEDAEISGDPADNPYDYRNFVAQNREASHSASPPPSAMPTPEIPIKRAAPAPAKAKAKPKPAVAKAKAKPQAKPRAKPKSAAIVPRDELSPSPPSSPPSQSQSQPQQPTIRLDRRASTKQPSPSPSNSPSPPSSPVSPENDGFTIDMGDSPPSRRNPRVRGLGLDLLDNENAAPMSLHSVANSASPASQLHTPNNMDEEIDFGFEGMEASEEEDAEGEMDVDVPDIDLGPPAHGKAGQQQAAEMEEEEDADGDLEEMMMEEMMASEESEEE